MTAAPKKKFTIKINEPVKIPADFEESNWKAAFNAVDVVMNKKPERFSSEAVCTSVRLLCDCRSVNYAQRMYEELKRVFETHASQRFAKIEAALEGRSAIGGGASSPHDTAFATLRAVVTEWNELVSSARTIGSIFIYLDCDYVAKQTREQSIVRLAQTTIGSEVAKRPVIDKLALDGFLGAIADERMGNQVDRVVLAGYRSLSLSLQTYFSVVEPQIVSRSREFFAHEAQRLIYAECVSPFEYFLAVQQRLAEERDRVQNYLDSQTRAKLSIVVQEEMLRNVMSTIMNEDAFKELVKTDGFEGLKLAFQLCSMRFVDGAENIRAQFRAFLISRGKEIVSTKETEDQIVPRLIELRIMAEKMIAACFTQDHFRITTADAFEVFIKPKQMRTAELLARFVDSYLKEGGQKCSEAEAESALGEAMKVFDSLPSKDVFEAFYARDFAKRLTYQRCASMDNEMFVIRRLGAICGPSLPKKLEGMIRDIDLSKELNAALAESQVGRLHPTIDIQVNVYTQGYWPAYEILNATLPDDFQAALTKFNVFYASKHKGRRLSWLHSLSTCLVRAQYNDGKTKKEITMSFIQGLLLHLFNETNTLTLREIKQRTALDGDELTCALLSLSAPQQRMLVRAGPSTAAAAAGAGASPASPTAAVPAGSAASARTIDPEERFEYNAAFTSKLVRFRLNQIQLREQSKEDEETAERVMAERCFAVDAAIVRFMKSRRRSSHTDLCGEVVKLLRFPVTVLDIKKRVEVLIEREYLKRDDNDPSFYEYLA